MGKVRHIDWYHDEWIAGTYELSNAERGLYVTACCLIYSVGGPITRDRLRAACRGDHGHAFTRQLNVLIQSGKLSVNGEQIINKRCENELQKANKRVANAEQNGGKGGRPSNKNSGVAESVGLQSVKLTTNYQLPTTNLKKDRSAILADFASWYEAYPRHVARKRAEKAYLAARTKVPAEALLSAIERYRAGKPAYADWKHPASWLNGECWADEYGATESIPDRPRGPPPKPEDTYPDLKLVGGGIA
jgi:uncharacterized protein YdaU (DUF1376 family)